MAEDLLQATWAKSSRSGGGQDCVEVARNLTGVVAVRDSKDPAGPALVFGSEVWRRFTDEVKGGRI
ncbi:DUF397 domain-containing protein [Spirillospora sp. CA-294931]|uniref:DUF397 domain-containing protein n=1 Tax=Spirillospora sp. CA-294931 TaxID=3240042 RepID=UPI003D930A16